MLYIIALAVYIWFNHTAKTNPLLKVVTPSKTNPAMVRTPKEAASDKVHGIDDFKKKYKEMTGTDENRNRLSS